jgi:tetratricopeptide (TPR) repeat protein
VGRSIARRRWLAPFLIMSIDLLVEQASSHHREGQFALAETHYREAIDTEPNHWGAGFGLAQLLIRINRFDDAIRWLSWLLRDTHDSAAVHRQLGLAHACKNELNVALGHFQKVLDLEPDNPATLHVIANFQQELGQHGEANATFRRALELKPLITIPAVRSPPDFRALFVFAPGAGNTPFTYLVEQARFESNVVSLLENFEYDVEGLRRHADVVINLIADVDQSRALLGPAQALIDRIDKPVVNHPRLIVDTSRDSIARRLADTPHCRVPQTRFFSAGELETVRSGGVQPPLSFPLLARPAGTHGGKNFEKMNDPSRLNTFLTQHSQSGLYLTPYVDYRSDDGYYRKYRFIFVNKEILPYHLAIGDGWKVHHATTDMANRPWMQTEEQRFLEDPWQVFGAEQQAALESMRDVIGLDYFGIDCGLDREGAVVMFEVNACMLVHGNNDTFPYKTAAVERIKQAFHSMLAGLSK